MNYIDWLPNIQEIFHLLINPTYCDIFTFFIYECCRIWLTNSLLTVSEEAGLGFYFLVLSFFIKVILTSTRSSSSTIFWKILFKIHVISMFFGTQQWNHLHWKFPCGKIINYKNSISLTKLFWLFLFVSLC